MAYVTPQSTAVASAASGTAVSVAFPSGISAGHLLIVTVIWGDVGGTCTTPTGFTEVHQGTVATTSPSMATFFKIAVGSESGNITCTISSNVKWYARSMRLTGNNSVGMSIASENYDNTSDTSAVSATVTPTATSTLLMIVGAAGNTTASGYAVTTSNPALWTEYVDAFEQDLMIAVAYGDRTEITATGAGSATLSGSARSATHLLSLEPAGHSFEATFAATSAINATFAPAMTIVPEAFSITASMPDTTITEADMEWQNTDKHTSTWLNQDKT